MVATISVSAWVVREANWVKTPGLWLVIFLSTLTALSMAKISRLPWPSTFLLGLVVGVEDEIEVEVAVANVSHDRGDEIGSGEVGAGLGNALG